MSQLQNLLEIEPKNTKALYIRGKSYLHLKQMDKAYDDFKAALLVEPQNEVF